jgi:ParB family transcriptional regulator, chromosome partitioning protein
MASSPENDNAAARLRRAPEPAVAPLEFLPANLLVPPPEEEFACVAAEPPARTAAVETLRDEITTSPALQKAAPAARRPPPPARPSGPWLKRVPIAAIRPLATLLQRRLEPAALETLAASLKRHGMALPLLVRPDPQRAGSFEVFVGHRRWRAALLAGLAHVPVIIFPGLSESVALEMSLLENLHRSDLTLIEEAETFRVLADRHGRTPQQLAALSGRTPNQVANMLYLVALPEEVRVRLRRGQLSYAHGRALLGLQDPAALARRIVAERLSLPATERLVAELRAADAAGEPAPAPADSPHAAPTLAAAPAESPPDLRTLQAALALELGAPLELRADPAGSTLLIQADSPEQIETAIALLRDALRLLRTNRAIGEASRKRSAG